MKYGGLKVQGSPWRAPVLAIVIIILMYVTSFFAIMKFPQGTQQIVRRARSGSRETPCRLYASKNIELNAYCKRIYWPILLVGRYVAHTEFIDSPVGYEDSRTWIAFGGVPLAVAIALGFLTCKKRVITMRRRSLGLCAVCGYNLRASPEQCPECGAVAEWRGKTEHSSHGVR